jgi:hypothetical protein
LTPPIAEIKSKKKDELTPLPTSVGVSATGLL